MTDQQPQAPFVLDDFIDENNPPETGPISKPKPAEQDTAQGVAIGMIGAFAAVAGDVKPYSAKEQGEKTYTVEFFDQETRSFKARDYSKYYTWQSFRSESRAASDLASMAHRIDQVRTAAFDLLGRAPAENADQIKAKFNHFAKRHIEFSMAYISANANIASAMVTGPSNFPQRRQEKLRRHHDNKATRLNEHIEIGKKSLRRAAFPHGDPKNGIRSDNPEAIQLLERKITKLEQNQEFYKKANRDVKAAMKAADPVAVMVGKGYSEREAREYTEYKYSWMRTRAFDSYVTSNNLANIKRLKGRLAGLRKAKETKTEAKNYELENGETFEIVRNSEAMRIQLLFNGKPSGLTRAALKSRGFKWAPSQKAWQRHLNNNGEYALERLLADLEAKEGEAE